MHVSYKRSGGIGGPAMRRTHDVDTDELPAAEARELERLVDASGILTETPMPGNEEPRPDSFSYRIAVKKDGEERVVRLSDRNQSPDQQALLHWLQERATAAPTPIPNAENEPGA